MTEETKAERQQGVQQYISSELTESNGDVLVSYHLTSIYDHSTLEAFSKVSFYIGIIFYMYNDYVSLTFPLIV